MKEKFVIISHGRSGSTLLCGALNQNPMICCGYELFGPPNQRHPDPSICNYESGSGGVFLENFYRLELRPVMGFKIFTFHARDSVNQRMAWRYLIENKDIKCIFLERKDLLAAYISEQRATKTSEWHPADGAPLQSAPSLFIDPEAAERHLYRIYAEMQWAKEQFSSHQSISVSYEEMRSDVERVIRKVSQFLGVGYADSGLRFQSLLGEDYISAIENYDALMRWYEGSIFFCDE